MGLKISIILYTICNALVTYYLYFLAEDNNATIHECIYDGKTYKDGQQFNIKNDYLCVCSPEFNGK